MKIAKKLFVLPFLVFAMSSCGKTPEKEVKTYTVTWKNYDGTVLEVDKKVEEGSTPHYDGAKPTKDSSVSEVFSFKGWSPKVVKVTKNATYTAEFTASTRKYSVQWIDGDGQVIKTDQVAYGTLPVYEGDDPTKSPDESYNYSFNGWEEEIVQVTEDATYHATFNQYNNVTVVFKNYDGSTLGEAKYLREGQMMSEELNPVTETPVKPDDGYSKFEFIGWDRAYSEVTPETTVYTACFLEYELVSEEYRIAGISTSFFEGTVTIPNTYEEKDVTQVEAFAFNNKKIRGLNIGNNVTYIGESAFVGCDIEALTVPTNLSIIDSYAFSGCEKLKELEIESTTLMIRDQAFRNTAIQELEIPAAVTHVGYLAFANCDHLIIVSLADTSVIQNNTFAYCGSVTEVWLPNGGSISGSNDLSSYYYTIITGSALDTDKGTFTFKEPNEENEEYGLVYYKPHGPTSDKYLVSYFGEGKKLGTGDATKIKKFSFYSNKKIQEVKIGKDVIVVEEKAFYAATAINKFELEEGTQGLSFYGYRTLSGLTISSIDFSPRPISHLGFYLLEGCTNLKNIVFSSSTNELYDYSLSNCGFEELTIPSHITIIGTDAFRGSNKIEEFIVDENNSAYKSSVDGCLYSKDGNTLIAFPSARECDENTFTIPEGVTHLRGRVFQNLKTVRTINLPSTLEYLGEFAFLNCNATTVNYPGTKAEFEALDLYGTNPGQTTSWARSCAFTQVNCLGDGGASTAGIVN